MFKICSKCHIKKAVFFFKKRKNINNTSTIYYKSQCIECEKETAKISRSKNKSKLSLRRKTYYLKNKEIENKNSKKYYTENKQKIIQRTVKNNVFRYKHDPVFKLKLTVSRSVRDSLKERLSSKNNLSVWKYLPYSKQELKEHLEKQFEPWMTWDNWRKYDVQTWIDNNQSTWTWNIDHIVSQSIFLFTSMDDDEFKKCWALSNLRPYSAKQNIIDGARLNEHL